MVRLFCPAQLKVLERSLTIVIPGSGGLLADIVTTGGLYGLNLGNQQFTTRNLTISNAVTGISQIWNWGWTYQGLQISNTTTAIDISNGGSDAQNVGSVNIIDSSISDSHVFVTTAWTTSSKPAAAGSLILENISLNNVPVAVNGTSGTILEGSSGSTTISGWGQGHKYTPTGPNTFQGTFTPAKRPTGLVTGSSSNYYTKSKPQFEATPTTSIVSTAVPVPKVTARPTTRRPFNPPSLPRRRRARLSSLTTVFTRSPTPSTSRLDPRLLVKRIPSFWRAEACGRTSTRHSRSFRSARAVTRAMSSGRT